MAEIVELPAPGAWRAVTPRGEQAADLVASQLSATLLATDFDGTLSPIVDDPLQARMDPSARTALQELAGRVALLAVVTGRELGVVRQLAALDDPAFGRIRVLGQYGQESWDAASDQVLIPPAPASVRTAIAELQVLIARQAERELFAGVHLEDKVRAVGVHTRQSTDPERALQLLEGPVRTIAAQNGLQVEPGRNVLELRSSAMSKGDALGLLLDEVQPRVAVMMGDDLGDIPAFDVLVAREQTGGPTAVRVVSASAEQPQVAAHADVLCGGPTGVAAWLDEVARAANIIPGRDLAD